MSVDGERRILREGEASIFLKRAAESPSRGANKQKLQKDRQPAKGTRIPHNGWIGNEWIVQQNWNKRILYLGQSGRDPKDLNKEELKPSGGHSLRSPAEYCT